jgi:hypothetical protein
MEANSSYNKYLHAPICTLSNALEELGYKWHLELEDNAGMLLAPR